MPETVLHAPLWASEQLLKMGKKGPFIPLLGRKTLYRQDPQTLAVFYQWPVNTAAGFLLEKAGFDKDEIEKMTRLEGELALSRVLGVSPFRVKHFSTLALGESASNTRLLSFALLRPEHALGDNLPALDNLSVLLVGNPVTGRKGYSGEKLASMSAFAQTVDLQSLREAAEVAKQEARKRVPMKTFGAYRAEVVLQSLLTDALWEARTDLRFIPGRDHLRQFGPFLANAIQAREGMSPDELQEFNKETDILWKLFSGVKKGSLRPASLHGLWANPTSTIDPKELAA